MMVPPSMAVVVPRLGCAGLALVLLGHCNRGDEDRAAGDSPDRTVLARIDDATITLADFERRMQELPPYVRSRYAAPERRKEMLDNLVRFEVLAREARKRGYQRDPDVIRFAKQRLVEKMIAEEIDAQLQPEDLPEADLAAFYRANPALFTQAEAVRVSQIVVSDRARAVELSAQARALGPKDEAGFRRLVSQHSLDDDSRLRGGDLTFIERASTDHPAAVVAAAFALRQVGDVSDPVASDRGFHVLRLTQRRAGFLRPFEEVKADVRKRLHQQRRAERVQAWVAEMRKNVKVELFEDKLEALGDKTPDHPPLKTP